MTKLHNPHKTNYYYQYGFKTRSVANAVPPKNLCQLPKHTRLPGNQENHQDNHAYEETPDSPNYSDDISRTMYKTCHDSGMSDLSEIQYKFEEERPYSQASTDSEDSGFRSSRSGQYLHSAQNSNVQEVPILNPLCSKNKEIVCQSGNVKNSETCSNKNSSHHFKRKHKPPKHQNHWQQQQQQKQCIDLHHIHMTENKSPIATISQKPQQQTVITAMVHNRPILTIDHNSNPVSYSVV